MMLLIKIMMMIANENNDDDYEVKNIKTITSKSVRQK